MTKYTNVAFVGAIALAGCGDVQTIDQPLHLTEGQEYDGCFVAEKTLGNFVLSGSPANAVVSCCGSFSNSVKAKTVTSNEGVIYKDQRLYAVKEGCGEGGTTTSGSDGQSKGPGGGCSCGGISDRDGGRVDVYTLPDGTMFALENTELNLTV